MTVEEIKKKYGDVDGYLRCDLCPVHHLELDECKHTDSSDGYGNCYRIIRDHFNEVEDIVNHPNHYTHGGMECIDEMIMVFGKQTVMHFCLCNAWKYRYRAVFKNGEEDIKKSHWYMAKYKELRDGNYQ